jgi:hypothetical protein
VELRRQQALELPTAPQRVGGSGAAQSAFRRALLPLVVLAALALGAGPAHAQTQPTAPSYDERGNLIGTPFVPEPEEPLLTPEDAIGRALANDKVADWVARYPERTLSDDGEFDEDARVWTVKVWSSRSDAGQIALAKVDDVSGAVTEAWTGPQVAWKMARGYDGAFGRKINEPWVWLSFCAVFLLGLADLRRPLSVRNLDLLVLLSFGISLWFFNRGEVFTAMPLAYPPLLYLLGRMAWIGRRGSGSPARPLWPVWVLLAATVFLSGFRFGLNVQASNVIDVGLAGVIGAQRIVADGESPFGNMPTDEGEECGEPDADGYVRERIQTNRRCEVANGRGDTYGPVSYLAYVPGFAAFGWSYEWDDLPAAHFTSLLWDGLALLGLGFLGLRFGGARLGATLAFAWAAYPFTQYVSSSNSNDAIMPALLIWGLVFVTSAPARGLFAGLAAWTKFAAFLLFPLWASYPRATRWPRQQLLFLAGALLATAIGFWMLLLEPDPLHAARVFWDRTFGWQLGRPSPFSIWDWDEYAGYPDLHLVQSALKIVLVVAALALAFVPRTRNVVQLAALSAALMIGFELVLTHWFYLYIPWFFPFVAFALLVPASVRVARAEPQPEESSERAVGELVPTR